MAKKLQTNFTETATQLFSRYETTEKFPVLEKALFSSNSNRDVIEIVGEAGSGKTELLYHFVAQCILPPSWQELELNGLNINVTFIDNDCRFNIFRLVMILELRVLMVQRKNQNGILSSVQISSFVTERLKLLNIVKCYDSSEFIVSLCSLENVLRLGSRNVIMIDSLTAFYWIDKLKCMNQFKKLEDHQAKVVNIISKLSQNCSAVIIATKQILINRDEKFCNDNYILGRSWKSLITCQIELKNKSSEKSKTVVSLHKSSKDDSISKLCAITDSGFSFP